MKKRGISDVITTVLIILLVLAAVVIIWTFIRGAIQDAGGKITADCITLELKPIKCEFDYSNSKASISYNWVSGDANLAGVKYVLELADETRSVTDAPVDLLPGTPLDISNDDITPISTVPLNFRVAGIVATETGDRVTCTESRPIECVVYECNDGLNNDDDAAGLIDLDDPGCDSLTDETESPDPAT